jgi:hypothetical protein
LSWSRRGGFRFWFLCGKGVLINGGRLIDELWGGAGFPGGFGLWR